MAQIKCSYDTDRKKLADIVPIGSPLSMYIEPTKRCNFKCFYCMHATRGVAGGELDKLGYKTIDMQDEFYDKIVNDIMEFKVLPKRICFSGLGEPLLNANLPQMIKKLRNAGYSERIDVITNGYALSHEMSDELIAAGVSRIQISIQGIDAQQYKENCRVDINFDKLVDNITYFYKHKKDSTVFIKIIDELVKTQKAKEEFFGFFSGISDQIFIEHLIVMQQPMGDHGGKVNGARNLNNEEFVAREVCPVSFYHLQVSLEGNTFPCPVPGMPQEFSMGNAKENSLVEIWNGKRRNGFLQKQIKKQRKTLSVCGDCVACAAVMDENENLDNDTQKILEKLEGER